MPEFYVQV